jgi:deoxyribodipyrimidine photo-lyase
MPTRPGFREGRIAHHLPMSLPGLLPALTAGDPEATRAWVAAHLGDLTLEGPESVAASPRFRGGQGEADRVLSLVDVRGYAGTRNTVLPESARGASAVSPYVRHGLIPLRRLWEHVADAPPKDRTKYRDELLWQEYARHLYARLGPALAEPLRHLPAQPDARWAAPWPAEMACMRSTVEELERDGWLVNQTRMWMSSQWTVRAGWDWREGEDRFFTHLLDGSRAANRLGWQWTVGAGTGRPYGFSRWQVRKRAPQLCRGCALRNDCPIEGWPDAASPDRPDDVDPRLRSDPDVERSAGPLDVTRGGEPEYVWLTAESLGDADPALAANPQRPVVFVFDEPLLAGLRLSGKRLVFLAETLGDLAARRDLHVLRGRPTTLLSGLDLAVTFAPVPGFRRRSARLAVTELHPWPWLSRPHDGSVASFSAWRKANGRAGQARGRSRL